MSIILILTLAFSYSTSSFAACSLLDSLTVDQVALNTLKESHFEFDEQTPMHAIIVNKKEVGALISPRIFKILTPTNSPVFDARINIESLPMQSLIARVKEGAIVRLYANEQGITAYLVDPIYLNEFSIVRILTIKQLKRKMAAVFHQILTESAIYIVATEKNEPRAYLRGRTMADGALTPIRMEHFTSPQSDLLSRIHSHKEKFGFYDGLGVMHVGLFPYTP